MEIGTHTESHRHDFLYHIDEYGEMYMFFFSENLWLLELVDHMI
jgi:hypothetical protein